jgi:hypothetical protein
MWRLSPTGHNEAKSAAAQKNCCGALNITPIGRKTPENPS